MKYFLMIMVVLASIVACTNSDSSKKTNEQLSQKKVVPDNQQWRNNMASIVKLDSYDGTRILETGCGFFVAENLIVTKYSLVKDADNVLVTPFDESKKHKITKYVAFDRINDLIILEVSGISRKPIELINEIAPVSTKSIYLTKPPSKTIPLYSGKVLKFSNIKGLRLYKISNKIRKASFGTPVFVPNKKAIGIAFSQVVDYELQSFVIPAMFISDLLRKKEVVAKSLESLRGVGGEALAAENSKIKGLLIQTDKGDIRIRLFNETPAYRDNFIKLVKENFYDSLLIHRVISGFCIQSGAADTRYAGKNDVIGWKGPGYTIPAHTVLKYFHKKGMIGSPRKPDTKNAKRRSDGSQFYIVSGRLYNDMELDNLEKENNYKFSAEQRNVYKTVGGAPHIDGAYTVFGEVISGMNVVDLISKVEVNNGFRPLEDIRIKKITILQ